MQRNDVKMFGLIKQAGFQAQWKEACNDTELMRHCDVDPSLLSPENGNELSTLLCYLFGFKNSDVIYQLKKEYDTMEEVKKRLHEEKIDDFTYLYGQPLYKQSFYYNFIFLTMLNVKKSVEAGKIKIYCSQWKELETIIDCKSFFNWALEEGFTLQNKIQEWLSDNDRVIINVAKEWYVAKETLEEKIQSLHENGITNIGVIAKLLYRKGVNAFSYNALGRIFYIDTGEMYDMKDASDKIKRQIKRAEQEIILKIV